jgi:hypothetical protein
MRGNTNALTELKTYLDDKSAVKCAEILYRPCSLWEENIPQNKDLFLPIGYTQEEFNSFLKELDFNYDSGYGGQELYGVIWLEDGTWMSRGEYDGSEWWEHNVVPEIPNHLFSHKQIKI